MLGRSRSSGSALRFDQRRWRHDRSAVSTSTGVATARLTYSVNEQGFDLNDERDGSGLVLQGRLQLDPARDHQRQHGNWPTVASISPDRSRQMPRSASCVERQQHQRRREHRQPVGQRHGPGSHPDRQLRDDLHRRRRGGGDREQPRHRRRRGADGLCPDRTDQRPGRRRSQCRQLCRRDSMPLAPRSQRPDRRDPDGLGIPCRLPAGHPGGDVRQQLGQPGCRQPRHPGDGERRVHEQQRRHDHGQRGCRQRSLRTRATTSIITNITTGPIVVPEWVLLANDTRSRRSGAGHHRRQQRQRPRQPVAGDQSRLRDLHGYGHGGWFLHLHRQRRWHSQPHRHGQCHGHPRHQPDRRDDRQQRPDR